MSSEPLLDPETSEGPPNDDEIAAKEVEDSLALAKPAALPEAGRILRISWPISLEGIINYAASQIVAMVCVGRLGALPLAALCLARALINITGYALIMGITGSIDTFASQAFGAKRYVAVGVTLQRALLITTLACVPTFQLYILAAEHVLLLIGQEPDLAAAAAGYVKVWAIALFLHAWLNCLLRHLIAQGIVLPILGCGIIVCASQLPLNWLFVFHLGWGLDGAAFAALLIELLNVLLVLAVVVWKDKQRVPAERTWQGWSYQALNGWAAYLKVGLPSLVMVCLDWWTYDFLTLLAGRLPDARIAVDVMGIAFNLTGVAFMIPFGLGFGVAARVGNLLGAMLPGAARVSASVGFALGLTLMLVSGAPVLVWARQLPMLFTSEPDILDHFERIAPLMFVSLLLIGGAQSLMGALRGCGRQNVGALSNLVSNWLVGLSLQAWLAFRLHAGVRGIWIGLVIAQALQTLFLGGALSRFDFLNEARRAQKRIRLHAVCTLNLP